MKLKSCNFLILSREDEELQLSDSIEGRFQPLLLSDSLLYIYTKTSSLSSKTSFHLFQNNIMDSPSNSCASRTTSSSSSESPPHSPAAKRFRFDGPSRNPSPVRCPPQVPTDRYPFREERRNVLYSPWKNPVPNFVPEPRTFVPGLVKSPTDWLESLSQEENRMALFFINKIKIQHESLVTRHHHLVEQLQRTERDIRRHEVEPKNWTKVGLDKISSMPMFLRDYCDSLHAKKD